MLDGVRKREALDSGSALTGPIVQLGEPKGTHMQKNNNRILNSKIKYQTTDADSAYESSLKERVGIELG